MREQMKQWQSYVRAAISADDLEKRMQEAFAATDYDNYNPLLAVMNERGKELVRQSPLGRFVPIRLDRGRGCSRRYSLLGKIHQTGSWGNGAGYRWTMAGLESDLDSNLKRAGLRSTRIRKLILEWALCGWPHRALREVERIMQRRKATSAAGGKHV